MYPRPTQGLSESDRSRNLEDPRPVLEIRLCNRGAQNSSFRQIGDDALNR